MRAAKKIKLDSKRLQELVPLNALSEQRFREVSEKIVIEEVLSGHYLFRKGDRDNQSVYLLEGKINLIDGFRKVTSEVESGTDISRYPIANQQPRTLSARAVTKCVIARVDSGLLDVFLTWDQTSTAEVVEIGAENNEDWMTRLLQSEAFIKIPPSMIQSLLIKMESCPVKAGEVVIRQGDSGDYFYTIHEGRCAVTRREDPDAEEQLLAELGNGDSFGEDALVSDARRNATVTMLSDGQLMRLAKQDFVALLKNQLVRHVNYEQAAAMVEDGAVWVDVRTADEYEHGGAFEDSVNIPLSQLRNEISELVFNSKYIICCDTGRRSESAGFLLSHKGFDVYVLEGGVPGLAGDGADADVPADASARDEPVEKAMELDEGDGDTGEDDAATQDEEQQQDQLPAGMPAQEVEQLHSSMEALRGENESLSAQLQDSRTVEQRLEEQLEQLRAELGESGEKLSALYAQTKADNEQLELLRAELGESGEKLGMLYASEKAAAAEQQSLQEQCEGLQQELRQLRDELAGTTASLEEKADRASGLETDNASLSEQVEALRAELESVNARLAAAEDGTQQQARELEQQVQDLQEQLQEHTGRLSEASAEQAATAGSLQQLQQDNEALRTELRESGTQLEERGEQLENLQADLQAAEAALQHEQAQWESERETLQQALESGQQALASLREEMELAEMQASEDRTGIETELKSRLDEANGKIEQLEIRQVELKQAQSARAEEQEQLESERARLEQQLVESDERFGKLQAELDTAREQLESAGHEMQEQLQQLQQQLEQAREQAAGVEQLSGEKDAQIESLHEQLASQQAEQETLQRAHELLLQQQQELRQQLEQQEELARSLEQENEAAVRKAHEDLTRKNDNEKELQGQIDRLRKKLEQQTLDHKQAREGTRDDLDNLREQLHAERQERADERAEMAARQRELKEQLAAIAVEHESKLTRQTGAIEEARDAVRQEEQERLREILAAHAETENQVAGLQQELKQAHEEIAELVRQEKDRRTVDVDLIEEQNQQAVAAIAQLESQLRQLTEERDATLEDRQALRDRMNTLRGEVEVARGLMGVNGKVEDPAQLRKELDESRKNVEIALRLRAEAEAARDRLLQERESGARQDDGQDGDEPLHVPSLDGGEVGAAHPGPQQQARQPVLPSAPRVREQDEAPAPLVDERRDKQQRRWLGAAIGLGAVVVGAVAGWVIMSVDGGDTVEQAAVPAEAQPRPVETAGQPPAMSVEPDSPVETLAGVEPASGPAVAQPLPETEPAPGPDPVADPVAKPRPASEGGHAPRPAPVTPGKTFRDALQRGGQGPEMVELPAGSFQMGSVGNSLNYDEVPRHRVSLPAFNISRHEVTFEDYDRFARATGRRLPYDETWGRGKRPVINVSWKDARAYTRWLSEQTGKHYRLPTEAEWEYAARAGSTANFWWHDDSDELYANCFNCGSEWDGARTAPVGSFPANDFGLYDVSGNVQEWTADCFHGNYQEAPVDGSAWLFPECTMRSVRGGAYTSPRDSLRSAKRSQYDQDTRLDNIGFRVVREN